jgi:preprotein translocase subunit SecA
VSFLNNALKAKELFKKDKDYVVVNGEVLIVDEFTGRMLHGRRYNEGMHQAIEAKEGVQIQNENQTLATITLQNYFRLYDKLAGMTGTAMTEANEFQDIYKLDVIEIPTNEPCVRKDSDDEVYRTAREKYESILKQVTECQARKQPVLIGTVSIEKSETLSELFKKNKLPHNVLNARYHEQEAYIIAQAGKPGAVTIATNMAGRGTDIQLGGNLDMRLKQELPAINDPAARDRRATEIRAEIQAAHDAVVQAGGLYVIGSERHESRRIDNQLRGRSGRQGDPGASKFFVSLEDDLMRIFGSQRMDGMLQKLGLQEGEAIIHSWINKALEKAQQKVEARNYEMRKHLLRFDDVMNDQRKVVYQQRREIMSDQDISSMVADMRQEVVESMVERCIPENALPDQWDTDALHEEALRVFNLDLPVAQWAKEEGIADSEIRDRILGAVDAKMAQKVANYGPDIMRLAERSLVLQTLDQTWKDHLSLLDHLRQGISLRAYAQRDPLNEYKREAFDLFQSMLVGLREQATSVLAHVELKVERPGDMAPPQPRPMVESRQDPAAGPAANAAPAAPAPWAGTPRNAPCPCGSGKKFKHCHGRL